VVCNLTPVPHHGYRVGVPFAGEYAEILNTDSERYGGSNVGNLGSVHSEPVPMHGRAHSLALTLPPLATLILRPAGELASPSGAPNPHSAQTRKSSGQRRTRAPGGAS
jgi:1,4-alpha-glucan branching enzyme